MCHKMIYEDIYELENRINQMRENLIQIAKDTGLNSNDTLNYSRKLDELILKYQHLKMRKVILN
jgi:stage 0 sporulation regulatory protein